MATEASSKVVETASSKPAAESRRPTPMGQTDAPDILSVLRGTDLAASISPEGSEYIRQFQEHIKRSAANHNIEIHNLSYPAESQAIICRAHGQKNGIMVVFDEAIMKTNNSPTVAIQASAHAQFKSLFPDVNFLQMVVVSRKDYPKCRAMASNIINALIGAASGNLLTVDSLRNYRIELVQNYQLVSSFIERLSGHAVPDRMDFGFLVNCVAPNQKLDTSRSFFAQTQDDHQTIAAVTGYVTFLQSDNYYSYGSAMVARKYVPIVHISNIVTPVQMQGLMALVIPLAAMSFIDNRQWEAPFRQFGGKNSINIGNLIPNTADGSPYSISNLAEFEQFKNCYLEQPVLTLDVSMGRFMIPGLAGVGMAADPSDPNASVNTDLELRKAMAQFLKVDLSTLTGNADLPLGQLVATELTGTIAAGGEVIDSRYADYLNLMIGHSTQMSRLNDLLLPINNPEMVVNLIREFNDSLDLLYFTHRLILNPYLVNNAKSLLQQQVRILGPENGAQYVNVGIYSQAAADYANTANVNRGYSAVTSPFMQMGSKLFG